MDDPNLIEGGGNMPTIRENAVQAFDVERIVEAS
jgi:hypothetical protein